MLKNGYILMGKVFKGLSIPSQAEKEVSVKAKKQ